MHADTTHIYSNSHTYTHKLVKIKQMPHLFHFFLSLAPTHLCHLIYLLPLAETFLFPSASTSFPFLFLSHLRRISASPPHKHCSSGWPVTSTVLTLRSRFTLQHTWPVLRIGTILFVFSFICLSETVSLCSPGWTQTHDHLPVPSPEGCPYRQSPPCVAWYDTLWKTFFFCLLKYISVFPP